MAKVIKVEKGQFDAVLRKMIGTPPMPKTAMGKSKKKLIRIIEPLKPSR